MMIRIVDIFSLYYFFISKVWYFPFALELDSVLIVVIIIFFLSHICVLQVTKRVDWVPRPTVVRRSVMVREMEVHATVAPALAPVLIPLARRTAAQVTRHPTRKRPTGNTIIPPALFSCSLLINFNSSCEKLFLLPPNLYLLSILCPLDWDTI